MKKVRNIGCVFILAFIAISAFLTSNVYADFWNDANSWYNGEGYDSTVGPGSLENIDAVAPGASEVINTFSNMVNILGTTVIVLVTIFLGIKYMFGSFDAKADVKESLITLLVACVFFFGWQAIWGLLFQNGSFVFNPAGSTYETVLAKLFNTLTNIANFLAIGGVLYVGIRYIFSGASGKADLKGKSGNFIIGIILAFCSVGFLNLVSEIIGQIFG